MKKTFRVYLFNHETDHLPYKAVAVLNSQKEAMKAACTVLHALATDHRQELYCFMEEKNYEF